MSIFPDVKNRAAEYTKWRRTLHAMPELAFEEKQTSDFIAARLESFGIEVHRGLAQTSVIGILHGRNGPGNKEKSVALRADMDALPMQEENTFEHMSCVNGKMHGCGHDGHSTMLLAAAEYLAEHTEQFDGTIYFIFQPAEEDQGGADHMVRAGFFDKYPCKAVYGLHNWPSMPMGKMAICKGPVTANCDEFNITIKGRGGHAAWPHFNIDVVTAGSAIVNALQTLVSRRLDPARGAVVSTCIFQAGTAKNVMPETAKLGGTVRSFGEDDRKMLHDALYEVVENTAKAYGVQVTIDYEFGYPSVVNSADETDLAAKAAKAVVGAENVDEEFIPVMGSEDFAYFLQHSPGAYIVLGQGSDSHKSGLHSPTYDFNDDITPIGASWWITLAEMSLPV